LNDHPHEVAELVKSLLIKVTEFFRDTEAFTFLENEIVPKLIETGRERGRVLRFWSAGCATGEEAYSLALLIAHMLGRELPEWSVKIFATDVDEEAIGYARRGFYPPTVLRNLHASYKARFFEPVDHGLRISKSLRQMIIFGQQDLSRGVPFPRIDLVTCRNLLIYFKPELQQAVLDLFAYSLHQTQGYLFLGKAETARPTKSTYELINKKWKIYRCVSGPLPIPARPPSDETTRAQAAVQQPSTSERARVMDPRITDEADLRRINEVFLRALPTGICVIDRNYRIVSINASARRLLGVRDHAMDHDFLHTVRGLPYSEVRGAIDRTFREHAVTVLSHLEMGEGVGEGRFLTLQIIPFEGSGVDSALVCVENVTEVVQTLRRLEAVQSEQGQLTEEVGAANRRLMEMNKDLQDANEELQAANEEMMLAQEELQATNEEFEATNEELQATNEELETNNEELQATNEELETTNEELQARTSELQELTRVLTGERGRLSEIVEQAPFHVMVLRGPSLLLETMNPPLAALFHTDLTANRPFDEICTDLALEPVRIGVRRAFVEGRPWYSEWLRVGSGDGERYYQFSGVPTHEQDGKVDGVVLYAEDVTERRLHEEAEKLSKIRLMLDHANQLAMGLFDADGHLVHASQQYLAIVNRLCHIEPSSAVGQHWSRLWFGSAEDREKFEQVVRLARPERLPEVRAGDGEQSVWDCTLIPIAPDQGGPPDYVVLTCVEVTRPVLAREALEQVNRLKDTFLSMASHELRTPLTPLAAYVEVLAHLISEKRRDADWEHQVSEVISKFRRQITYMSRLTEDLVDISRIRSGQLALERKPVDLKKIVEEGRDQAEILGDRPKIELDEPVSDVIVNGDEIRLTQVVYNLLSNSIKHASSSDRIRISVLERDQDGHRLGRVEVEDSGPGIPIAYRDDLFQRFLSPSRGRVARSGMGLGLFISAQIVEQHGGRIGVDHLDSGTKVWFEIPLVDGHARRTTAKST
jgi:two-component system CheB/CheR fusion protein